VVDIKQTNNKLPSNNKVEEALKRWRSDIAKLEFEIENYVMPAILIQTLS
jgi:hypothetical protein